MGKIASASSFGIFAGNIIIAIILSVIASLLMLYLLTKNTINVKFFLLFAILAILYSVSEKIHLPSLLLVLIFGLVLNNNTLFLRGRFRKLISNSEMDNVLVLMKSITAESSFLIRTFFFILFGYSIQPDTLVQPGVIETGSLIIAILLAVRFLYLRFVLRANLLPELFLMPRGLVTILLFYSIPVEKVSADFNIGILFYVIVISSLLMMIGLMFFGKRK
jgi:hypothetical protein